MGDDKEITTDNLWSAWEQWQGDSCEQHLQRGEKAKFGRNLKLAFPDIERIERRTVYARYWYKGIDLKHSDHPLGGDSEEDDNNDAKRGFQFNRNSGENNSPGGSSDDDASDDTGNWP